VARPLPWLLIGVPSLAAAVLLVDASVIRIEDGSMPVTVTVQSDKPCRLQKVTYGNFGNKDTVDQVLQFPGGGSECLLEARVRDDRAFTFDVPTSEHESLVRIVKNTFYWRRYAVFRIECESGEPILISAAVPDPRRTKSLTIRIP